jgi:hypothetical protein
MIVISTAHTTELTESEQRKQKLFHSLTIADALTTIVGVGKGLKESSWILGATPEPHTVIGFFIARNLLQQHITEEIIPAEWRDKWQNSWIAVQGAYVLNNLIVLGR